MTASEEERFALCTDVAVMVTVVALVTLAGAAYVADVVVVFISVPAPVAGEIDQVTPEFVVSAGAVAARFSVWPWSIV